MNHLISYMLGCYVPEDITTAQQVVVPHGNDILFGRGGNNNKHVGNERLRRMARENISVYKSATKKEKSQISRTIVNRIHSLKPRGRYLKRETNSGLWVEVGEEVAREKTSQALRDAVSAQNAADKNKSPQTNENAHENSPIQIDNDDNIPPPPPMSKISSPTFAPHFSYPAIVSPERTKSEHRKSTTRTEFRVQSKYPRVSPVPDLFNEFIGQIGSDMGEFDLFNGALLRRTDSSSTGSSLSFLQPREKKMRI